MDFSINPVKTLILAPYLVQTFSKFTQGSDAFPGYSAALG